MHTISIFSCAKITFPLMKREVYKTPVLYFLHFLLTFAFLERSKPCLGVQNLKAAFRIES